LLLIFGEQHVSSPSPTHLWPHCCHRESAHSRSVSLLQGIMHLSILRPRVSTRACPPISAAWLFASSRDRGKSHLNITPRCPVFCTHNVWLHDVTVRHEFVHFVHLPLSLPLPTSLFHSWTCRETQRKHLLLSLPRCLSPLSFLDMS
jgi:hypothetical protein